MFSNEVILKKGVIISEDDIEKIKFYLKKYNDEKSINKIK